MNQFMGIIVFVKFDVDIYSGGARGSHQVKTTECMPVPTRWASANAS